MSDEWGRAAEAGKWQRALPIWFMSVILLAVACGIGTFWVRQAFVWTPLQQFYVSRTRVARWPARSAFGPDVIACS
jgi:hypothetical protein